MSEVEKFVNRLEKANKVRSKEIRLSISEAHSLANELALSLERENKLLKKVTLLQAKIIRLQEPRSLDDEPDLVMDGGGF